MKVKTHLITISQHDDYEVKWVNRLIDMKPQLKNELPTFVIISNKGRMELNTINILQVEKAAMKFSMPKGKESITSDRSYIYIKEQNNIETLLGIITHYHVRDFAPMYDEL
mgnify:FL=1|jgi:hypothetical protein